MSHTKPLIEQDSEERCECGQPLADNEGYDYLCGNCADHAEHEGQWG